MQAEDKMLKSINVKRILDKVIQDRNKIYTKDDFHFYLRPFTSYSRIEEAVNYLRDKNILKVASKAGAPPKREDKNARPKAYFELSNTMSIFEILFQVYASSKQEKKFLNSAYTTQILYKHSLLKVHKKIIQQHIDNSNFRQIASSILLNHPAVIREYEGVARELNIEILGVFKNKNITVSRPTFEKQYLVDKLFETALELLINKIEYIDILSDYDSLMAVRLYRRTIHKSILKAYIDLAEEGVITEGLKRFLIFDNYLSPLTAYPVNGTLRVLFSRPFERIYEDAYLLDGESFELLSGRAAAIYCDFSEFIFELIKTDTVSEEGLKTMIKRMIYHWNVASTRFDLICINLNKICEIGAGSGNYHLKSDGLEFNIIDLESGKKLLSPEVAKSVLMIGSSPAIFEDSSNDELFMKNMKNPFTCLRPCLTFRDLGWKSDYVNIDDILSQLNLKLAERNGGSM